MIEDMLQSLESETASTVLNFGHSDTLMVKPFHSELFNHQDYEKENFVVVAFDGCLGSLPRRPRLGGL